MASLAQLVAKLKGGTAGALVSIGANSDGHLFVAQFLAPGARAALDGEAVSVLGTTAVACVQADPVTAGATVIYNNEQAGGKTYIFDEIFCEGVVAATAIEDHTLMAAVIPSQSAVPANTQTSRMNMKAGVSYAGNSRVAFGITLDAAPVWKVVGGFGHVSVVADNGFGTMANIAHAPFVCPPQTGLAIHVIGTSVTDTFFMGAHWIEHQFDSTGN